MDQDEDAILQHILTTIASLVGGRPESRPDALIGADFGVEGWDSIELLEKLEAAYDIDLRPFADARATTRRFLFWKIKVAGDATPRELARHIAALLSGR